MRKILSYTGDIPRENIPMNQGKIKLVNSAGKVKKNKKKWKKLKKQINSLFNVFDSHKVELVQFE